MFNIYNNNNNKKKLQKKRSTKKRKTGAKEKEHREEEEGEGDGGGGGGESVGGTGAVMSTTAQANIDRFLFSMALQNSMNDPKSPVAALPLPLHLQLMQFQSAQNLVNVTNLPSLSLPLLPPIPSPFPGMPPIPALPTTMSVMSSLSSTSATTPIASGTSPGIRNPPPAQSQSQLGIQVQTVPLLPRRTVVIDSLSQEEMNFWLAIHEITATIIEKKPTYDECEVEEAKYWKDWDQTFLDRIHRVIDLGIDEHTPQSNLAPICVFRKGSTSHLLVFSQRKLSFFIISDRLILKTHANSVAQLLKRFEIRCELMETLKQLKLSVPSSVVDIPIEIRSPVLRKHINPGDRVVLNSKIQGVVNNDMTGVDYLGSTGVSTIVLPEFGIERIEHNKWFGSKVSILIDALRAKGSTLVSNSSHDQKDFARFCTSGFYFKPVVVTGID